MIAAIGVALLMVGSAVAGAALALAYFEDLCRPRRTVQDLHVHVSGETDVYAIAAAVQVARIGSVSA